MMFAAALNAVLRMFARAPEEIPRKAPIMLNGIAMRYLIGATNPQPALNAITMCPYMGKKPPGLAALYCNLFRQDNEPPRYAPYWPKTDVGRKYREGRPDPEKQGFRRNVDEQFAHARREGFLYVETDNRDAYPNKHVLQVFDWAQAANLYVFVKNPGLAVFDESTIDLVKHAVAVGMICEEADEHTPEAMDELRRTAGKPHMPVWFVSFGPDGRAWADKTAKDARAYVNMGVSYDPGDDEYAETVDVFTPRAA